MTDTIITKELLVDVMEACEIGPNFIEQNNLWGQPDESVICPALCVAGLGEAAQWWLDQKKTEKFVRYTGKEITMTDVYQVFNPFTGQHTEYVGEEAAREAALEITRQILETHKVSICRTIQNENGDSAWTASEFSSPIQAV